MLASPEALFERQGQSYIERTLESTFDTKFEAWHQRAPLALGLSCSGAKQKAATP